MYFLLQAATQLATTHQSFGVADVAIVFTTVIGALTTFLAIFSFFVKPKFREMVQDTISGSIGKQIEEVPRLVLALEKLTLAIEHQNQDTIKLDNTIKSLDGKVDMIAREVYDLSSRTANLEGTCRARHLSE